MIINPKTIVEQKIVTAEENCPEIEEKQIQQVGIDIRISRVFTVHVPVVEILRNSKPDFNEIYRELMPDTNGCFRLMPGKAYSVDSMEHIKVPNNAAAFVLHRSTFNRSGIFITGSVFDAGFEGNIGATMYVHNLADIEVGTRIAQVLVMQADAAKMYDGTYQQQRSHKEVV